MKRLVLKYKTGFQATDPKIFILDSKGFPFYVHILKHPYRFNLPRGTYYVNQKLIKLSKPLNFKRFKLPPKQYKNRSYPKKWKISYQRNPNKATVNYAQETIIFDTKYKNCPRIIKDYIYAHELGHKFYKTEKYADLFAVNELLRKGYNPSQILKVHNQALSDVSMNRKWYILNNFKNHKP